ncbi:MAG: hypothetical protein H7840_01315 [Alphaproteobacteria bacterium]
MDEDLKRLLTHLVTRIEEVLDVLPTLATKSDVARLEERQTRLEAGQAELEAGQAELKAGQDELKAGQDELKAGQAKLEAKVDVKFAELEAKVNDVKHIVAANYHRTSGKIEQVGSMLAEHIAVGHRPAA